MSIVKITLECFGCGKDRPCIVELNRDSGEPFLDLITDDLVCILDSTNQTGFNWNYKK